MEGGGLAKVALGEVVRHALLEKRAPHERLLVDDLCPGVKLGPIEQVEHVRAHDRRRSRVLPEEDGPADRLGLDAHIVVEELHEVAVFSRECLDHGSGEAAGAPEVRLTKHNELLAQTLNQSGEFGTVADEVGALIDDEDAVDELERLGSVGEVREGLDAVVRLVERGDPERRSSRAGGNVVRGPFGAFEGEVLGVGHEIEPDPAAIAVLVEHEFD